MHFWKIEDRGNISQYYYALVEYNKNILEYAQIARSGPKSMIRVI